MWKFRFNIFFVGLVIEKIWALRRYAILQKWCEGSMH